MLNRREYLKVSPVRVRLRRLYPKDATPTYAKWFQDKDIQRWITHATPTVAECRDYIVKALANPDVRLWGIFVSGRHVGNIKARRLGDDWQFPLQITLGLLIGNPKMRGHGIGSAAIRQATRWCFRYWRAGCVMAGVHPFNTRSMRAFEKANFQPFVEEGHRTPRVWLRLEKP